MNLDQLLTHASNHPNKTVAIASAADMEVIEAVKLAVEQNLASFILYGDQDKVVKMLNEFNLAQSADIKVVHESSDRNASKSAVTAVSNGEADVLMKGMVSTSVILKEVLNKEYGLRKGKVLSHVAAFDVAGYDRLIFVTDSGMNIKPDLTQKIEIVKNAVSIARGIGIETPKVASLAAVEVVNPSMQATLDAAALTQMNTREQITNCIIDGPLALDNAISIEAAAHKGIKSEVAGRADILLVPSIEVGNALYKSLVYFSNAKVGGVIAGAKAPIVLTSRADSAQSKVYSIALAVSSTN
ncbi:phosphate butyryltransferase [Pseudalkalibacillus hwajinpoensis]|uniref:Phosphate butyryltransferase n=1 Tax=Guptibacillus hwajinpoensis TaxID=208199 RepID=A0A4U1MFM7_9BACL|nr:phosphate butyryltransferase [Pseudalkalibacillus hwajinpoensis]TKD70049.1 phosphate butyryltransferase [Pseudalkalibacillus hwajinpoensis]